MQGGRDYGAFAEPRPDRRVGAGHSLQAGVLHAVPVERCVERRFRSVYKEARVAAKVPESSGFAGQLLGRTVVALVGSEGLKEDDPLVKLEKMDALLLK